MLAVTERDRIQTAFRRFATHQPVEAIFREHRSDRAQPIRSFGVPRRRHMFQTCRVSEKKRGHATSWRVERD
jgi:hypothetical protein